ncbi:MAG: hypothetical protein WAV95_10955 [Azonexus sp.]
MKNFSLLISVATLCLLLAGCYETFSPIKSANVTHWPGGKPQAATQQLEPEQVEKLSAWLQSHRWGWYPVIATYLPATLLSVKHSDGTATFVNLMHKILIVGQNQRNLSESESQELHSIIGVQIGS